MCSQKDNNSRLIRNAETHAGVLAQPRLGLCSWEACPAAPHALSLPNSGVSKSSPALCHLWLISVPGVWLNVLLLLS